jgi:DNA-binding MarR family transcriptional regulator
LATIFDSVMLAAVSSTDSPPDLRVAAELERLIGWSWWRLGRELSNDLSRTGASVLKTLYELGPQRITTLAANEPVAQPTMSAIVQRLERRGLVSRADDPDDRRANLVQITVTGEEVLRQRVQARVLWLADKLAGLSDEERETVMSALTLLGGRLDQLPPQA